MNVGAVVAVRLAITSPPCSPPDGGVAGEAIFRQRRIMMMFVQRSAESHQKW
jgi:hypothetical protein